MQRHRLPNTVSLKVLGLVSHADLLSWMHVADVLITKAGGMTPAEAFTLGTPTILLDVVGGHERVNAALFVQLGVAELAVDAEQAGELAQALLMNRDRMEAMRGSQREFLEHANIASIALFALDDAYTRGVSHPISVSKTASPFYSIPTRRWRSLIRRHPRRSNFSSPMRPRNRHNASCSRIPSDILPFASMTSFTARTMSPIPPSIPISCSM